MGVTTFPGSDRAPCYCWQPFYPDDNCPNGRLTGNNHPLRGRKGDVYEGGTRVPTIVSWPARVRSGRLETPVQITDWMPTFCSLAGYEAERDLKWDGANIAELLMDQSPLPVRPIYTAGPNWRSNALRFGDWKLIVHGIGESQRVELFNVVDDPSESTDRADVESEKVKDMLARLHAAASRDRDSLAN
ncbi:MAG TPA: sulfatase-like hydrolase/transferase [Pirellulaceae bacterium]|nr:sulfatase-like hydrolase/transferase [Pirellulaceae bacterium]